MQERAHSFAEAIAEIEALQHTIEVAYDACDAPELPDDVYRNAFFLKRLIMHAAMLPIGSDSDASRALELIAEQLPEPYASLARSVTSYLSRRAVP